MRAYARGRAYDPNRFGGVTAYVDPDTIVREDKKSAKKKDQKPDQKNDKEGV